MFLFKKKENLFVDILDLKVDCSKTCLCKW